MALAALRIAIDNSPVDAENGVISGCILAQSNRLATFSGPDGNPVEVMVTPALIDSLLNLASVQARLDAYWTHDRLNPENSAKDPIHDSVGVWSNFRKNENGDLVADISLEPSGHRERILWKAQNDKRGIMTSLVFNYQGGRNDAVATQIISGDFVRFGAATTALLSAHKPNTMTPDEIKTIACEAAKAALAEHIESTKESTAALSKANEEIVALKTQIAKLSEDSEANTKKIIESEIVAAEARFTAIVGQSGPVNHAAKEAKDFDSLITAQLSAGAVNQGRAIAAAAKINPEAYAKWVAAKQTK